jgi:hypothetical protein
LAVTPKVDRKDVPTEATGTNTGSSETTEDVNLDNNEN